MEKNTEHGIEFSEEHRKLNVSLEIDSGRYGTFSKIKFEIDESYSLGQFDIERKNASKSISLKEAEQLIEKLNKFIENGNKFLLTT